MVFEHRFLKYDIGIFLNITCSDYVTCVGHRYISPKRLLQLLATDKITHTKSIVYRQESNGYLKGKEDESRGIRNSKSGKMTHFKKAGINTRTHANHKRTDPGV